MHKIFLSRRNVQTLLNKLDRVKSGDFSNCTLIKCDNLHAKYPQTMEACRVTAVELFAAGGKNTSDQIYLSRETLTELLTKPSLSWAVIGENDQHEEMLISCLEDAEYYDTRQPGEVHPADDPLNKR